MSNQTQTCDGSMFLAGLVALGLVVAGAIAGIHWLAGLVL